MADAKAKRDTRRASPAPPGRTSGLVGRETRGQAAAVLARMADHCRTHRAHTLVRESAEADARRLAPASGPARRRSGGSCRGRAARGRTVRVVAPAPAG